MDNQSLAAESFKEALIEDVYCYDAFESLVHHQMLSADEGLTKSVVDNNSVFQKNTTKTL